MTCAESWNLPYLASLLAMCLFAVPPERCAAGDPKIFPINFSEVDCSKEIRPEPRGGDTLLPLRTIDYEELQRAVWRGGFQSSALLSDGADPNAMNDDGEPILFYAIRCGRDETIKDFLQAGAKPNVKDRYGDTPLHFAIRRGPPNAVALLLKYGADPQGKNSGGMTTLDYARKRGRHDLATILEAERPAVFKATPIQPPKVLRQPDTVFGSTLFRPAVGGEAVIYSADGKQVISGDAGGAIRFFDALSGRIQNVIAAHDDAILELALIPGSRILVSASNYHTKFWDMDTSQELLRLQSGCRALSVSPNGRWIFTGFHIWEIESTDPLRLAAVGRAYPQAGGKVIFSWSLFTPDNRFLILGIQNGYVWIWNLSNDFARRIGDLKSTEMKSLTWRDLSRVADVGAAPLDELLVLATDQYTILTGPAQTLKAFQPVVTAKVRDARSLACSPDGQYLAALGYPSRIDVYDLERNGERIPYHGHTAAVAAVATSPDGRLLASGGDDLTARIWNRRSGKELARIPTESFVYSLCFSADGKRLAIGDNVSNVYMFDIQTGAVERWHGGGRITGLMFNSEGDSLIVLGDALEVLDAKTGQKKASVSAEGAAQGTLAVTPDNLIIGCARSMAATETFKVPHAWSFDDNELVPRKDLFTEAMGHRAMILTVTTSPDGTLLAAESNGTIRLWDLKKRKPLGDKLCGHNGGIAAMRFSPDGQLLASGGWDGTVRIWEISSSRQLLVFDADVYRVSGIAFFPDGGLVTGNQKGTVHLWDLPSHLRAKPK